MGDARIFYLDTIQPTPHWIEEIKGASFPRTWRMEMVVSMSETGHNKRGRGAAGFKKSVMGFRGINLTKTHYLVGWLSHIWHSCQYGFLKRRGLLSFWCQM
jgi:hypothetical protein